MSRFYFNVVLLSLCGVCDFGSVWGGLSVNTLGWVCELAWIMMPSLRRLQIWGQTRKMQGFCRKRDNFLATAGPRRGLWGKFGPWCRKVGRPQSDLPSSDLRPPTCISFLYSFWRGKNQCIFQKEFPLGNTIGESFTITNTMRWMTWGKLRKNYSMKASNDCYLLNIKASIFF